MIEIRAGGADVLGTLDFVRNIRSGAVEAGRIVAARADALLVEGWALQAGQPADCVFVLIDGQPLARMVTGINRPDLPTALGPGTDAGGYRGIVSLRLLGVGEHDFVVAAGTVAGGFAEIGRRRLLVTEPAARGADAQLAFEPNGWTGQAYLGQAVAVRGHVGRNGVAYDDVAAIIDDRHVVHGRFVEKSAGAQFEVVLSSEQFGLGTISLRMVAFVGGLRYDAPTTTALRISLEADT